MNYSNAHYGKTLIGRRVTLTLLRGRGFRQDRHRLLPEDPGGHTVEAAADPASAPPKAPPRAKETPPATKDDLSADPTPLRVVRKGSVPETRDAPKEEGDTPERFWLQLQGDFLSAARQKGYADGKEPFLSSLIAPGIEFTYALMTSQPFYDGNKQDIPRYYYKIARYCFYAGAYYAYLWDKQSTAYLEEDFHLKILRADLPATAAPLMSLTREEVSGFCLDLYLRYADEVAQYVSHPEYPVFVANGMHAFYMAGVMVQMHTMRETKG